ncbi:MAG: iron ABC transporter substrate-binding protein [Hyphomicrobiaceae bacterium]|nr:iron ABC transporter substrate-binding protein [Hyphomicrobiaceae bacterium]
MRLLLLAAMALWAASAHAAEVTDGAGRKVMLPDTIERVFAAGGPAAILLYVLAPETMTGWPRTPREEEKPFIAAPYRSLPEVGMITGRGGSANIEAVMRIKPDLILDFGSVKETYVSLADATQQQTQIPYVLFDGRFEATPASLRRVGAALGRIERGETLARYVEARFAEVDAALKAVPPEKRPKVYLARGPDGLESGAKGSINTEIIERAGGRNIIDAGEAQKNIVRVSIEQIIVADPDIILTWDRQFFDRAQNDPLWQSVKAVREGRLYLSPTAPFGWIDRPPSVNRIMGLTWAAQLFYPDRFTKDLRDSVREFYGLFYQVTPTDAELDGLIEWSRGKAPPREPGRR